MNGIQCLFGGADIRSTAANLGLTVLRVFSGLALAFAHGLGKVPPSERFIAGVAEIGLPLPAFFAWSAGLSEFAGGLLLALGFCTRPAAFFILVTMLVAGLVRHAADPFGRKEKAFLYAGVALLFLLVGAGRWAVDARLRKSRPE